MHRRNRSSLLSLHLVLSVAGVAGLAGSVAAWPQTFLFGKVLHLPHFAAAFASPTSFPSAWILLVLAGPAASAPNLRYAMWSLAAVLVVGAAAGVPWPASDPRATANYLFNIAWIAGFHGGVPFVLSLFTAAAAARFRRPAADRTA